MTAVAAFESVGSILVIAMLIVPAASAQLLTDRLGPLLLMATMVAILSAILGHVSAITVPKLFGFEDTNTAGMMAVMAGLLFSLCVIFAPRKGLFSRFRYRLDLSLRMVEEDILGLLYRLEETKADISLRERISLEDALFVNSLTLNLATYRLRRQKKIIHGNNRWQLTETGRDKAKQLVRSHRIWEVYLNTHLTTPHIHTTAHRLEHALTPIEIQRMEAELDFPDQDPHGTPIPTRKTSEKREDNDPDPPAQT